MILKQVLECEKGVLSLSTIYIFKPLKCSNSILAIALMIGLKMTITTRLLPKLISYRTGKKLTADFS